MAEGEAQRTVSAHGDSSDRSIAAALADAVFLFDERDKFLQKKIAVANGAVGGVDVKTPPAFRSDDEKITDLLLLAKVVEHCPCAAVEKRLLVIAQAVEKIEDRIVSWRALFCAGVVASRKVDTVVDWVLENSAVHASHSMRLCSVRLIMTAMKVMKNKKDSNDCCACDSVYS